MYSAGFSPQIFPSLSGRQLQLLSLEIKDGRRLICAALEVQDEKSPHLVTGHLGLQQPLREQSTSKSLVLWTLCPSGNAGEQEDRQETKGHTRYRRWTCSGVRRTHSRCQGAAGQGHAGRARGTPAGPPSIWDRRVCRAPQALGKRARGLFGKKRTEANMARTSERKVAGN